MLTYTPAPPIFAPVMLLPQLDPASSVYRILRAARILKCSVNYVFERVVTLNSRTAYLLGCLSCQKVGVRPRHDPKARVWLQLDVQMGHDMGQDMACAHAAACPCRV